MTNSMRRLNLDELEEKQIDTERSEGLGRRDPNASQEKKPSLLQQAFPNLLSPKVNMEPRVQLPMKRENMIPRLRDRPNSKPVKQFQQPPRKAFMNSDSS